MRKLLYSLWVVKPCLLTNIYQNFKTSEKVFAAIISINKTVYPEMEITRLLETSVGETGINSYMGSLVKNGKIAATRIGSINYPILDLQLLLLDSLSNVLRGCDTNCILSLIVYSSPF